MSRTKNATRNIVFGTIQKLYSIIVPFIMRTAMIYFMGVQYLGLNSLFTSILHVLNLAELGVGSAMVYSMYMPIAEGNVDRVCALLNLYKVYYRVIGLAIGIIGISLTPFIPNLIKSGTPSDINVYILYFLNLCTTVLSYWLFSYKRSILQANQRSDIISKVTIITHTLQYVFQLCVIVFLKNYYYYIIVALALQVINNLSIGVVSSKIYPNYQARGSVKKEERTIINDKIKDLFFIKIGSIVVNSVDSIVISAFLGLTLLAIYQNYFYIMNSIYQIVGIIFTSIVAGVGNSLITESDEKNYSDFKTLTCIMSAIMCFCCSCFVGLYQPFMYIWVGEDLMLEFSFVILLCIYFYIRLTASIWNVPKDAAGLWHSDRYRALVAAGVNLLLNIVMVKYIGLYGILLSTIIAVLFISCPWILYNVFKYIYKRSAKEYLVMIAKYAVCTVFSCAITYVLCSHIRNDGFSGLLFRMPICSVIPIVLFIFFFHNTKEFSSGKKIALKIIRK